MTPPLTSTAQPLGDPTQASLAAAASASPGAPDAFLLRFGGVARLLGERQLERLRDSHVCVVGVGGVGSWTVEALARTGVGTLTLIDLDEVCVTNTNRQLHAVHGQIGRAKIEVLRERIHAIHPETVVHTRLEFFQPHTADRLLDQPFDCVVDAIDTLAHKCLLLARCRARSIPVVTTGGAGGRTDPTRIRVADLARTSHDPLLVQVRKRLRQEHGFEIDPAAAGYGIPCVFSNEPMRYPSADGTTCDRPQAGESARLDCRAGLGAATFVTGTFGFIAAAEAVRLLLNDGAPSAARRTTAR